MTHGQCKKCKYCQKRWNRDRYGNFTTGYYGCHYLPHWGTHIETIATCPKVITGKEESSLSNVCKVNR